MRPEAGHSSFNCLRVSDYKGSMPERRLRGSHMGEASGHWEEKMELNWGRQVGGGWQEMLHTEALRFLVFGGLLSLRHGCFPHRPVYFLSMLFPNSRSILERPSDSFVWV